MHILCYMYREKFIILFTRCLFLWTAHRSDEYKLQIFSWNPNTNYLLLQLALMKRIKNITHKNYFVTHFAAGVINSKQKTAITNSLPNIFSQHSKMIIRMSGIVPSNLKKNKPNSPPPKVQRFSVIPPVLRNAPSVIWMKRYSFSHLL